MREISIIVLIRDAERRLRRFFDSALAQTALDVEIVAVDDGSTDGSVEILREYERFNPRIKAIYRQTPDRAASRNAALDAAIGKYVAFWAAADSPFEPSVFAEILRRADETGAEITRFVSVSENDAKTVATVATVALDRLRAAFEPNGPSVCDKIWRRDFLERVGLRFRADLFWEELDFVGRAALAAEKVATARAVGPSRTRRPAANGDERARASGTAESLNVFLDDVLRTSDSSAAIDWTFETRLKTLYFDFGTTNDAETLKIVAKTLRDGDWRRVFNANFPLDGKIRRFFVALFDRFLDAAPKRRFSLFERKTSRNALKRRAERAGLDPTVDFLERGKKAIEASRVVSFDVFDTLLTRPFVRPSDLFRYMEARENRPGFAEARTEADRKAWRGRPEITFEEIYREAPPEYADLARREFELERRVLTANPELAELYKYAQELGKPIFIVSDMYFTADEIGSFLEKNGFGDFEKLYVSAEYRKTKWRAGELFDVVFAENLEKLGCEIGDWLHVGDNTHSDVDFPKSKGMKALAVARLIDVFFDDCPFAKKMYENAANRPNRWETSVVLAVAARRWNAEKKIWKNGNFWRRLGWRVGVPKLSARLRLRRKSVRKRLFNESPLFSGNRRR